MLNRLLYRFSGRLPVRFIDIDGAPYLERYYVGSVCGITAYLHRFVSGDDERQVHDHPWGWAAAIVLAGGYVEERLTALCPDYGWLSTWRRMFPCRINVIRARDFHRVTSPKPGTWTLFITGPRVKSWGFYTRLREARSVAYYQPFDTTGSTTWHLTAPRGEDVLRYPLIP